jgi:hypothetical protein
MTDIFDPENLKNNINSAFSENAIDPFCKKSNITRNLLDLIDNLDNVNAAVILIEEDVDGGKSTDFTIRPIGSSNTVLGLLTRAKAQLERDLTDNG